MSLDYLLKCFALFLFCSLIVSVGSFSSFIDHLISLIENFKINTVKTTFESKAMDEKNHKETESLILSTKKSFEKEIYPRCNSYRLDRITNILDEIYINKYGKLFTCLFPKDLLELIENYDFDEIVETALFRVLYEWKVPRGKWESLNFYSDRFVNQLLSAFSFPSLLFKSSDDFSWYSLSKLIFKWMIYMRQMNAMDDNEFEKISNNIRKFYSLITNPVHRYSFVTSFNLREKYFSIRSFQDLIHSEFGDYYSELFPLFASAVEYFYFDSLSTFENGKNDNGNESRRESGQFIDCNELETKFFNGNYNQNILFKYFIVIYDPKGWMRACIIKNDPHSGRLRNISSKEIPINSKYLENLRTQGPNLVVHNLRYLSKFMFEYLLSKNEKIVPLNSFDLVCVLRGLKGARLLKREILEKIISFRSNNQSFIEWNREKFEELLIKFSSSHLGSLDEINEYLGLFDSPTQKFKRVTLFNVLFR